MTIDHHAVLSLVILMLKAQNGISLTKIIQLETLQTYVTTAGYSQLIDQPTHCANGSSSCIDLIFTVECRL